VLSVANSGFSCPLRVFFSLYIHFYPEYKHLFLPLIPGEVFIADVTCQQKVEASFIPHSLGLRPQGYNISSADLLAYI
jgi:hypothetical protein